MPWSNCLHIFKKVFKMLQFMLKRLQYYSLIKHTSIFNIYGYIFSSIGNWKVKIAGTCYKNKIKSKTNKTKPKTPNNNNNKTYIVKGKITEIFIKRSVFHFKENSYIVLGLVTFYSCLLIIKIKHFHEENKQFPDQFFEAAWIISPYLSHTRKEPRCPTDGFLHCDCSISRQMQIIN